MNNNDKLNPNQRYVVDSIREEIVGAKIRTGNITSSVDRKIVHKIIGKFTEIDGDEVEGFCVMKERLGLIGSLSGDVGDVEIYYDNNGNNYVIAHDSIDYYGDKCKRNFVFINIEDNKIHECTDLDEMAKIVLSENEEEDLLSSFNYISYNNKLAIVNQYGYRVLTEA